MKAEDLEAPAKIGAGILFFCKKTNRFLLIQRSEQVNSPLTWCLPGGKAELNEKPLIAAKREAREEAGIDTQDLDLQLIYTNETHAPRFRFFTFACIIDDEFEPVLNWESSGYLWCSIDDVPEQLHWGVRQMINSAAAAKRLKKLIKSHID